MNKLILEKSNLSLLDLTKSELNYIHKYFSEKNIYFDNESKIEEISYEEFRHNEFFIHHFKDFYILKTKDFYQFFLIKNPKLINVYTFKLIDNTIIEDKLVDITTNKYYINTMMSIKYKNSSNLYVGSFTKKERKKDKELSINQYYENFLNDEYSIKILKKMLNVIYKNLKSEHSKYAEDLELEEDEKYFIYLKMLNEDILNIKNIYYNIENILFEKSDKILKRLKTLISHSQNKDNMYINTLILFSIIKQICIQLNYNRYQNIVKKMLNDSTLWNEYKDTIETCKHLHNQFKHLDYATNFDLI